jgi:phosphoribosylpyrophosphate synthetase
MASPTHFKGKHVLFVASFHNNDVTMSQFHVIAFLCECLVESLTILLPYYSTATMERVDIGSDGVVPTANTLALLFNGLPSVGRPIRVMTYDLHTLQNRFYLTGHAVATLHTAISLVVDVIEGKAGPKGQNPITAIAFPDEGAKKRFGKMFEGVKGMSEEKGDIIFCSKVRKGDERIVSMADGDPGGKHVLIVDDQTKSGGTLIKCAEALKKRGAKEVSAYVTHAVLTGEFWSKIGRIESNTNQTEPPPFNIFSKFFLTDSTPVEGSIEQAKKGMRVWWTGEDASTKEKKRLSAYVASTQKDFITEKLCILPLARLVLQDL